jgi:hypothetical protein
VGFISSMQNDYDNSFELFYFNFNIENAFVMKNSGVYNLLKANEWHYNLSQDILP